jgi:hypothetical protein
MQLMQVRMKAMEDTLQEATVARPKYQDQATQTTSPVEKSTAKPPSRNYEKATISSNGRNQNIE